MIKCDKCQGTGFVVNKKTDCVVGWCSKCHGSPDLNWVEFIFGKSKLTEEDFSIRNRNLNQFYLKKSIRDFEQKRKKDAEGNV